MLTWLFDLVDIPSCPVELPNGDLVVATKKRYVCLSLTIILSNVHYVLQLSCILLLVSQLTNDLHCIVQFFLFCVCYIGPTKGVDWNGDVEKMDFTTSMEVTWFDKSWCMEFELWHHRMGHPSEKVVKLLPPLLCGHKGSLHSHCEFWFRAKHPRDKFPISNNKAATRGKNIKGCAGRAALFVKAQPY